MAFSYGLTRVASGSLRGEKAGRGGAARRGGNAMADKIKRAVAKREASATPSPASPRKPAPDPAINEHIGSQLKAMYDEVVAQPIPDYLLELLNRLDDKAGKK